MACYRIAWKRSAVKELRRLPSDAVQRVVRAVEQLSTSPFPHGTRKLVGAEHTYRIRVGDYRVIYSVVKADLVIEVVRIGHRRDVYRA